MENNIGGAVFELHISRSDNEYFFLLEDPSRRTSLLREKISIPHIIRNMIIDKLEKLLTNEGLTRGTRHPTGLEAQDFARMMTEFGSSIAKYMVPPAVREHLYKAGAGVMILSTDDVEIPWELLFDGENFLCLKYNLGRKVQTKIAFKEVRRPEKQRLTALFIADPTIELPDAEKEVNSIVQNITNLGVIDVDYLKQEEATVLNILEKLEASAYDILHYAGHVEFNTKRPEESVLKLYDDTITAAYLFQIIDKPPRFTFINACSSARTSGIEYLESQGKLTGMASAFLSSGVDTYVGTLWPVHDEIASELSIDFYKKIFEGEPVGLALRDAKKNIFNKYCTLTNTWASFILYGEPGLTLIPAKQPHDLKIHELYLVCQSVIVDIINKQGDTLVTIENEVVNGGDEPIPGILKDFFSETPLAKEDFDIRAVSSAGEELTVNFVTDLLAYKKIFICFPHELERGKSIKYTLSFKMKQEYNIHRESEYWEWPVEIPTQQLQLKVIAPKEVAVVESNIYDMSRNKKITDSYSRIVKEKERYVIIYKLDKLLPRTYKIIWKWLLSQK